PLDGNNQPLPFSKDIEYLINGIPQLGNTFTSASAGIHRVSARGYGRNSQIFEIVLREQQVFERVKIPIILHFINQQVPSQAELNEELKRINDSFGGINTQPDFQQDPNSVDTFVEFEWEVSHPDGSLLTRPGVHIVQTNSTSYTHDQILATADTNPCWTNFWDPNRYVNVWIVDVPKAPWGGLGA